jgi:hypothetical protein
MKALNSSLILVGKRNASVPAGCIAIRPGGVCFGSQKFKFSSDLNLGSADARAGRTSQTAAGTDGVTFTLNSSLILHPSSFHLRQSSRCQRRTCRFELFFKGG